MNLHYSWLLWGVIGLFPYKAWACDVCGCAAGTGSVGLLNVSTKHFIAIRSQQQAFHSRPHGSGPGAQEQFRSMAVSGRWVPHRRWYLLTTLPYTWNLRTPDKGSPITSNGLGDATVLAQWVATTNRRMPANWRHVLLIGAGVKLPTGSTQIRDADQQLIHPNLQPGTGSTDALTSVTYALSRTNGWGVAADAQLRITTPNTKGFRFGNRLNFNLSAFKSIAWKQFRLVPQLGVTGDFAGKDSDGVSLMRESGGNMIGVLTAVDVFWKGIVLGVNAQIPVRHQLAQGLITPQPRLQCSVSYLFGQPRRDPLKNMNIPVFESVEPLHH
jgi:hypothetical protein